MGQFVVEGESVCPIHLARVVSRAAGDPRHCAGRSTAPERPANYRHLLEQARKLLVGQPKHIRGCHRGEVCPGRCVEMHNIGGLNTPTYTGADYVWGPQAAGTLYGEWNIHDGRYDHVHGYFPGPNGGITVDLTEALA
jgi:hypothetical protein